jgi:hypothetical protein
VQGSTALSLRKYTLVAWMLAPAGLLTKKSTTYSKTAMLETLTHIPWRCKQV